MSRSIGHIMLEAALDWECDLRWDRAHTFISGMPSTKDHENEVMRVLVEGAHGAQPKMDTVQRYDRGRVRRLGPVSDIACVVPPQGGSHTGCCDAIDSQHTGLT